MRFHAVLAAFKEVRIYLIDTLKTLKGLIRLMNSMAIPLKWIKIMSVVSSFYFIYVFVIVCFILYFMNCATSCATSTVGCMNSKCGLRQSLNL